ncbi:hypothetical protein NC315_13575 [Streptomyces sp. G2]|uniref:hypothetical protein n=1 Tax=Streptomyces sp. G2 TaxID=1684471 RepID=UPI00202E8130|nr:hypothetical protein [Streptomyces sp. G2]MCM1946400.1 hypothetical protein [Streptomyces sp. G2]
MPRQHFDHSNCDHDKTKAGRAKCRKDMRAEAVDAAQAPTDAATKPAPAKKTATKPVTPRKSPVKPAQNESE